MKKLWKFVNRVRARFAKLLPGSTKGSKRRNLASYYVLLYLTILLFFIAFESSNTYTLISATVACAFAFVYFYFVILSVIFLISKEFDINPTRLLRDIVISMSYTVVSFAYLYKQLGIADSAVIPIEEYSGSGLTYLYFSAVTFSTLGFGDFRPMPDARIAAAIEALFGNLHLGLIAGAVFYLINSLSKR